MEFLQTIAAVLVGAALTFASSVLLDRRRERAAEERERRQEILDLRVAARLLRHELLDAMFAMQDAAESGEWPTSPLSTEQLRLVGPTVSRGLSFQQWATINIAYQQVSEFNKDVADHDDPSRMEYHRHRVDDQVENIELAESLLLYAANDAAELAAFQERVAAESDARRAQRPVSKRL